MRLLACVLAVSALSLAQDSAPPALKTTSLVLHAARLLDVEAGRIVSPAEVLVQGDRIAAVGTHVARPAGATVRDLGDITLLPGLIDVHVHLFLHVGGEAEQTINESVAQRTLLAAAAAKADVMAGFTTERDMGTEGAGCADVAVRNAINNGLIPGPRMRVSCNAIDISGGHEDTSGRNPDEHLLSNADRADSADEIIRVMRAQRKQGADFTKMYETGQDRFVNGAFSTPYQYTEAELAAAVAEAKRTGNVVAVHATGEPGTLFAAQAGVSSIDHADQLSDETMRLMRERQIYAVPTFAVSEYFAEHAASPEAMRRGQAVEALHAAEFRRQIAAGVPFAVGSDVGPFPHGTQARELVLMVQNGMPAADVLRADLLHGATLLGLEAEVGQLKSGFRADIIAVPGNPLDDIAVTEHVSFVMKDGQVLR